MQDKNKYRPKNNTMTSFTTSTQIVAICLNQTVKLQKQQQKHKTNPTNTVQSYVKKISRLKQGKKTL